uniref:C-type lectin domain-containing protein n=1 Tax=Neolamprologus brichardi TaxID=32507 RepID=A0A3Q4H0P6_NEOBR
VNCLLILVLNQNRKGAYYIYVAGNVLPHMLTFLLCCVLSIFSAHSQCQSGWREYENKCYFFSTDTKSWLEANEFCLEDYINNVVSFLTLWFYIFVSQIYWIGLNDRTVEGVWEWSDGSPFIQYLSYPDNWQNNEDCMHITGTTHNDPGKLNDDFCTATRDYICKKGVINAFIFASF